MGILFGFGLNFLVFIILGTIMLELTNNNPWYGLPILVLMILLTALSGYITANKSNKRKVINTLIVSILSFMILNSVYSGGDINPSYLDYVYVVQIIPLSLLGALINYIIQKKQTTL